MRSVATPIATSIATSIAIVIVNYNTRDHLQRCLASIDPNDAIETIVIDNVSTDGSAEMVRKNFPHVTLWITESNIGYGAAANEAIAKCTADTVLLLNSDTLLQKSSAQALKNYLADHPQAAIVGPRLHNADGTLQASCYPIPTPFNLFLEESLLGRLIAYLPGLRNRYLRTWRHDKARLVPWVLGAALAIRKAPFLAVGGFDPEFFMYFEETDLCMRLHALGWQIHFAPVTTIIHSGGASTSQQYATMQYRLFKSTELFYHRHFASAQLRLFRLAMIPIIVARLLLDWIRSRRASTLEAREKLRATHLVRTRTLQECLAALIS